jgi:hypothetical protein
MQLLLLDGEPRSPSWNRHVTAQPRPQAKLPGTASPFPGVRPHLAAGTRIVGCMGALASEKTPATTDQTVLASLPATTDRAETATGTTSKTPTTVETKERATTRAAEQGTTTRTAAATPPARSVSSTQSAALDLSPPLSTHPHPTPPPPPP